MTLAIQPAPGEDVLAAELVEIPDRPHFASFLFLLLLVPALLYLAIFALALTPNPLSDRFGQLNWSSALSFPYHAHQLDADVVIFGDSSAFLGVDPRLLNAQLGLHTVLLPDTVGSLPVTGDMPLRHYLAHNRPPRLIVFYFSAWNLDFEHTGEQHLFLEGEGTLFRYGSLRKIADFAGRYPAQFLSFPWQFASSLGIRNLKQGLHATDEDQKVALALGHEGYPMPYNHVATPCQIPADYLARGSNSASVQSLVRKYTSADTRVLVYLAPVPDCQNLTGTAAHGDPAVNAEAPAVLPPSAFAGDGFYAHILPADVPESSHLLAQAIESRLTQ